VFQLNTEFTAGEFFYDRALYFDAVFFTHSDLLLYRFRYRCGAGRLAGLQPGRLRTGN
jgi:hypothetical protein